MVATPTHSNGAVGTAPRTTFDSLDPASDEVVATFPIDGPEEVAAAVERARRAAGWWSALDAGERRRHLLAYAAHLADNARELGELVHRENGKPLTDALLEIIMAIHHLDWAARNARRVLRPRRRRAGSLMPNHAAVLEHEPIGVVGVIGPWNYPVFTPMGSIAYALAAGNAVVFKPSEQTPAIGVWLAEAARRSIDGPQVLEVVTGPGSTGEALCRAGVGKLAFTGSSRTGGRIMAACADTLTPVLLELGGKDALVVDDDADVEAAARAAVWGGLQNAGQACISIERVYATEAVHDRLLERIAELARSVRAGADGGAQIGPMTLPSQVETIRRHVQDALGRGARAVVGGADSIGERFVSPIVLADVPDDSPALREETFGPTIPVVRVRDADEAVERANRSGYGLGAAVFGKRRAMEIARRLRAGMVSVNSVLSYAAVPSLPFGGVGDSGFGRIHGDEGLLEFVRAKAIVRRRFPLPVDTTSFDGAAKAVGPVLRLTQLRLRRYRRRS